LARLVDLGNIKSLSQKPEATSSLSRKSSRIGTGIFPNKTLYHSTRRFISSWENRNFFFPGKEATLFWNHINDEKTRYHSSSLLVVATQYICRRQKEFAHKTPTHANTKKNKKIKKIIGIVRLVDLKGFFETRRYISNRVCWS